MLLSKLEAGEKQKRGGGQKVEGFRSKSRVAVMFATLETIVFLLFLLSDVCVCVSSKTLYNRGFSQFWPLFCIFGCKK